MENFFKLFATVATGVRVVGVVVAVAADAASSSSDGVSFDDMLVVVVVFLNKHQQGYEA